MSDAAYALEYEPDGQELINFMLSEKFVRGLRGPVGSGKSACCSMELFRRSTMQEPGPDGIRRTRWLIIRNTYPELKTTTVNTVLDWFPEKHFGKFTWDTPFTYKMKFADVESEWMFMAAERKDHIKKMLSLEVTGAWINEAREIPKAVVDIATQRVDRYPSMKDGGATWAGVIMDTNAPEEDHWWPIMAGDVPPPDWMTDRDKITLLKPKNWEFFAQPPAMLRVTNDKGDLLGYELNPGRNNGKFTQKRYYPNQIEGKAASWINVYILNEYGTDQDGEPVFKNFNKALHVPTEDIKIVPGVPLRFGIDYGLTGAIILGQKLPSGRWNIIAEYHASRRAAKQFGTWFRTYIKDVLYSSLSERDAAQMLAELEGTGDPAGEQSSQTDKKTPQKIMRGLGFKIKSAPTNDLTIRLEAVDGLFGKLIDGSPAIQISPRCRTLIAGLEGKYKYEKVEGSEGETKTVPKKDKWSHPQDAFQYILLGGGEGREALSKKKENQKNVVAETNFDPFARQRALQKREARLRDR